MVRSCASAVGWAWRPFTPLRGRCMRRATRSSRLLERLAGLLFGKIACAGERELIVTTDDGSYGRKALVTVPEKEILKRERPSRASGVSAPRMMKFVAMTSKPFGVKTIVSLNTIIRRHGQVRRLPRGSGGQDPLCVR